MYLLGLIGYPLGHSFSQRYFSEKFAREGIQGVEYALFPLPDLRALPQWLAQHPHLIGFNVTIPHKQAIVPYLHRLDPVAQTIGAVNTVVVLPDGSLSGYNTDAEGFRQALLAWLQAEGASLSSWRNAEALILGTGGSAQAVAYALRQLGIAYRFVSRYPKTSDGLNYRDLDAPHLWERVALIVNTTPVGMYPDIDECPPLPLHHLRARHWVFDLIYNPAETLLLRGAKSQGARATNGLEMLFRQAEAAWAIWRTALPTLASS